MQHEETPVPSFPNTVEGNNTRLTCSFLSDYTLYQEAERLVSCKVHPQIIVSGWRKSVHVAQQALESAAVDHSSDEQKFKDDLMNIARTTLSSKILMQHRDHFASLAVEAVLRLKVGVKIWFLSRLLRIFEEGTDILIVARVSSYFGVVGILFSQLSICESNSKYLGKIYSP